MWSFFSKDGSKDSLYEIEPKPITNFNNESLFILFKGKIKSNGKNVSIFKFDSSFSNQPDKVASAKASIKRLKTIRHPSIISIIDSNEESNDIFFVTEYVIPLKIYLEDDLSDYTKDQKYYTASYGLCQVATGLNFLNNDCNLIHNHININSIFITDKENWKIGQLDYVTDSTSVWPTKQFSSLERYDPPEKSRNRSGEKWTRDAYGLGCLIYEIFCGSLDSAHLLERAKGIPSELNSDYQKLINSNPNTRLKFKEFISRFRSDKSSIRNIFVNTMFFLDEMQIKDQNEKTRFFAELNENIDHFPPLISKKKILPKILESLELNIDTAILLDAMFKISKTLSADRYEKEIIPVIAKLYTFKDRVTRSKLLQNIEHYIEHLKPKMVNEIYLNVSQGFLDSNATIREQTVKSMLHFAPKLNSDNLNDNLLKNFSRIQVRDEETSIRTNTVLCLTKIACYLKPDIRQKFLVMAFIRSLRDPFPPARLAALNGLKSTQMFYPLQNTATQVMPALCHLTIDQEKKVRDESFKLLKEFIEKVHRVSEDPSVIEEIEAELETSYNNNNNKFTNNIANWSSWAMSSFTSKLISTKSTNKTAKTVNSSNNSIANNNSSTVNDRENMNNGTKKVTTNISKSTDSSLRLEKNSSPPKQQNKESDLSDYDDAVNDGWEDDIDEKSLSTTKSLNAKSIKSEKKIETTSNSGWNIDDEDILDLKDDHKPLNDIINDKKSESDLWGTTKLNTNKTATARTITKTANKSKTLEDELFKSLAEPTTRKKRGAMKLGAKKA